MTEVKGTKMHDTREADDTAWQREEIQMPLPKAARQIKASSYPPRHSYNIHESQTQCILVRQKIPPADRLAVEIKHILPHCNQQDSTQMSYRE